KTLGKSPEDIIRSVSSSIPILPLTMDIIESTANGTGNFFHEEWSSAIDKTSDREAVFIAWFDIEMYSIKFESENLRRKFAKKLYENRMNTKESNRTESGMYYWKIFQMGATLESIQWYISKRKSYNSHADMASEFPSDDVEAFKHSGSKVFNEYFIEELKKSCRKQTFIGEVRGDDVAGFNSLNNLRFVEDKQGSFSVWDLPEEDNNVKYR
ncbi:MAG: terminase, partial [Bacteroidaceae bacterium]